MVLSTASLVHTISREIPPAHAAFAEPLSCALHAVERATIGLRRHRRRRGLGSDRPEHDRGCRREGSRRPSWRSTWTSESSTWPCRDRRHHGDQHGRGGRGLPGSRR